MSFRVKITDTAAEKIKATGEPEEVIIALLKAIQYDLENLDRLNGFRSVAPVRFHTHRVVFNCPVSKGKRRYLIWVDDCYQVDSTRVVIDANQILSDKAYFGMTPVEGASLLPK